MSSGPTHRPRRDPPARPAAGLEHHARQGQPGAPGGDADGVRPGDRQRRHRRPSAGASGSFELNVMMPVIARNLLESIRLLAERLAPACRPLRRGITADEDRMRTYAESSPSVVTPLNTHIGYEEAAKVAKQALKEGTTIRETVIANGLRRARRPHRGAARRGARCRRDDTQGMTHGVEATAGARCAPDGALLRASAACVAADAGLRRPQRARARDPGPRLRPASNRPDRCWRMEPCHTYNVSTTSASPSRTSTR